MITALAGRSRGVEKLRGSPPHLAELHRLHEDLDDLDLGLGVLDEVVVGEERE